jgi:hypothetical protein
LTGPFGAEGREAAPRHEGYTDADENGATVDDHAHDDQEGADDGTHDGLVISAEEQQHDAFLSQM